MSHNVEIRNKMLTVLMSFPCINVERAGLVDILFLNEDTKPGESINLRFALIRGNTWCHIYSANETSAAFVGNYDNICICQNHGPIPVLWLITYEILL